MEKYYALGRLKNARLEAKKAGVKIPKFGGSCKLSEGLYGMFFGKYYFEIDANTALECRAFAIERFIDAEKFKDDEKRYDDYINYGC